MVIQYTSDLEEWIQAYEAYARKVSPLPDIDAAQWVHLHYGTLGMDAAHMDSLRSRMEEYLLTAGDQRVARFVVLCLYHDQLRRGQGGAEAARESGDEDEAEREEAIRRHAAEDLYYFLELPPEVEEIHGVEQIEWEVFQAYLAGHWSRVRRICERLREFPDTKLGDPRALHAFMVWRREIYGYAQTSVIRRQWPNVTDVSSTGLWGGSLAQAPNADRHVVRLALADLETAFEQNACLHVVFRAYQCDLLTAMHRFEEAAGVAQQFGKQALEQFSREFQRAVELAGFSLELEDLLEDDAARTAKYVGECLAAAGRTVEAIEQIEEAVRRCPDMHGLHRRLAELYAQENRFVEAARELAMERDIHPDADAWKDPVANIASTVYRDFEARERGRSHQKDQYLDAAGPVKEVMRRTIAGHWPAFRRLHSKAQSLWVNGCFWLYGDHDERVWPMQERFRYAIVDLAAAVEQQVFSELFEPFKQQEGLHLAAAEKATDKRVREFIQFLKADRGLSLGEMLGLLQMACEGAQEPVTAAFHRHLSKRLGKDLRVLQSDQWKLIVQARNGVLHPALSAEPSAWEVHLVCRKFLTVLDAGGRRQAAGGVPDCARVGQ